MATKGVKIPTWQVDRIFVECLTRHFWQMSQITEAIINPSETTGLVHHYHLGIRSDFEITSAALHLGLFFLPLVNRTPDLNELI